MKRINKNMTIVVLILISILFIGILIYKSNIQKEQTINYNYSRKENTNNLPTTDKKIKNIIYMIGDGMGENHIIAGELYKREKLNIQTIKDKCYVKTASTEKITDSAAAATALATGNKTNNGLIGKNQYGNNVENIVEFANKKGLKTGIICTQILCHATPAGFSVHNEYRYNYDEIVQSQIKSCVDLMLGGGREYFRKFKDEMKKNNCKWINSLSDLNSTDKEQRVIGTFANKSISKEEKRISLSDMVQSSFDRLENDKGFVLMIEGSDIDTYSHESNMSKMLNEMIDFDNSVGIAKQYVDEHPDTLLIVTADHETGGLVLDGVNAAEKLSDSLFTSNGQHTDSNVLVYAYGIGAEDVTRYEIIDNTSIYKFVKQGLTNHYEKE